MDPRIVIVGAGPAGALLAYLTSSRGIDTLLLERQSDFSREFRGEVLMPSGIRALATAGVDLERVAHCVPERAEAYLNGRPFTSIDTSLLEPPLPTAVSQPELLEALVELAGETGHFELRRGTTVRAVARSSEGTILLRTRRVGLSGEEEIRAPYLVGADGRGSVCRKNFAANIKNRSTPLDIVWFKMPYPVAWKESRARFEMGRGHLMIVGRSAEGLLQMAWIILKGTYGDLKSRSIEEWVDEMSRYTDPELAEHLRAHRHEISRPFLLNAVADRVIGWSGRNTLLIGDAAHTMSPVGAQGINLALRDAIVTANELIPTIRNGGDLDAAAARVESRRGPEIDLVQRMASIPPHVVMGRTPFHELARRTIARVADTRLGQRRAATVMSIFLDGVTRVELEV